MGGAFGAAAVGLGAGTAQADDDWYGDCGPYPCDVFQGPPGHNPFGPPGQVMKEQWLAPWVPNPVYGVPPGHWDDEFLWGPGHH